MKEKIKYDSGIRLKNFLQSEGIRQTEYKNKKEGV